MMQTDSKYYEVARLSRQANELGRSVEALIVRALKRWRIAWNDEASSGF
jgi:hypothetical protein